MIDRYTIKVAPAVSHKELLKKLETMTDPNELQKYYRFKLKIEMSCEAEDLRQIKALLTQLSTISS